MSTIAIIGVSGYAGGHIAREGVRRGHGVIGVSRTAPTDQPSKVTFQTGSIEDPELLDRLAAEADVVVVAVHAITDGRPLLLPLVPTLLASAGRHGARLGVVGGASSLLAGPGGPRLIDTPDFPAEYKLEASAHGEVLEALRASDSEADWFYVSPSAGFGAWAPGERTGSFRLGDDVLLVDAEGKSEIGGEDFAIAFLDEIERPAHHRRRFTVGY